MKLIPLSKGMFARVDAADYGWLMRWKWHASKESRGTKHYAVRRARKEEYVDGRRIKIRMHREILGLPRIAGLDAGGNQIVGDHINDDELDNRRQNLQVISQDANMRKVPTWKKPTL